MQESENRPQDDVLLADGAVRRIYPITRQGLRRQYLRGDFPKPIVIGGRKFWWRSEVLAALEARRQK